MEISIWWALFVTSLITGVLLKMIARETRRRVSAVYLKSLLEQVKTEKEKEKASDGCLFYFEIAGENL